jgi:MoxR-like ATPase
MNSESLIHVQKNIAKVVIGKERQLELLLVGLIAEGHVLIEDVPGVGKTLLAKSLAASINADFNRIQCTPDLTPTDVTGFNVFDRHNNRFKFKPGPVVTNILLVDEINRAVPRTQSSLLEAMEERQVSVDGQTIELPRPFLVIATQNPIEHEGTFPLPEAQLDRFLLKMSMGYPDADEEENILLTHGKESPLDTLKEVAGIDDVTGWQEESKRVYVKESLNRYIVELVRVTRPHPAVSFGASPRAGLALLRSSRALAMLRGRDYVLPDDIKYMSKYVLTHRLSLKRDQQLRGVSAEQVINDILEQVPVPVDICGE